MKAGKQEIPRRPLLWLSAGLAFTVPPMFGTLKPWVWGIFAASLVLKFWMVRKGWRLRSFFLKAAFAGAVLGGVRLTYHTLSGLEPPLSLFLLLTSIKVLEAHTARDFHVLALLGWLLCLAGLFITQDLPAGIYAVAAFMLVLAAVVQFHRGSGSRRPFSGPLLTSGGIVIRSLPVVIALFFLFPRLSPFRFHLSRSQAGITGLSNDLRPGSVSSLALSDDIAFRAEFPDGNMPPPGTLYWRAAVLTRDNGLVWTSSLLDEFPHSPERLGTLMIRQRIILQPHGGEWVFALEWPGSVPAGTTLLWGNVLRSNRGIFNQWHYEVNSYRANRQTDLTGDEEAVCTQPPPGVSEAIRQLVQSWTARSSDSRAVVLAAMQYFHQEKFIYTLNPGTYDDKTGLDDFLFKRRSGFCEHYAAAFATLMRVAHIPSRVVIGYHGGEFNTLGKYLVVHQSDAHAWCEVWLKGVGWQRADPTASVAGGDVGPGFIDMRETAGAGATGDNTGQGSGAWGTIPILRNMREAWDAVSYEWDSRVTGFDDETQQSILLRLGWPDTSPLRLAAWLAAAAALVLGAQVFWTWWRTRAPRDPLSEWYGHYCRRLAALGVRREPWEGPLTFADRAAAQLPALGDRIRRVAGLYISLRYAPAPSPGDMKEFRRLARV